MPEEDDLEAEPPLYAGKARVLPDSLYIEHFCSRSDLTGSNAGRLLRDALLRHTDSAATSGEIFKSVPQGAKDFSGLEAHERDHVRRLLGTSFGLMCHAFRSQQLVAARDLVIEAVHRRGSVTLPLDPLLKPSPAGRAAPEDRAAAAQRLQMALEHHIPTTVFREVESALAGWSVPGCTYVSAALPGDPARSTLAIEGGGLARWLTARHLLEMFGVCEHANRLLGTGSGIDDAVSLLNQTERTYTLPKLVWFTRFPTSKSESKTSGPPTRPGELYLGFYRLFPLEMFAAADLALWPPFTPDGLSIGSGEINWTDISPAFRFARILHAYSKLGLAPGVWPDKPLNEVIPELQQRVCELLHWPTPVELAASWHAHLSSAHKTWFVDTAVGGFRHSTTLQLLALRRDRPGDVVVNNVDYNALGIGRSPGWLTREPGGITAYNLASETDRQATEFWFGVHALLPAILGSSGPRLDLLKACTPDVRRACIDAFEIWGEAVDDWPREEFRRAASMLLGLSSASPRPT